jgi:hypothetical protein
MITDIIRVLIIALSVATIPVAILNYSMLFGKDAKHFLRYRVRKFLYALITLIAILSLKVSLGSTLLTGIIPSPQVVREFLTLALVAYFFCYNVVLLVMLVKQRFKPLIGVNVRDLILYTMVIYVFFDKVDISFFVDHISYIFMVSIVYTLFRLDMYLKIVDKLIEPIDVLKPTRIYIIGSYLTAIACLVSDQSIAKSMFLIAMIKAIASILYFDYQIRWVEKYTK